MGHGTHTHTLSHTHTDQGCVSGDSGRVKHMRKPADAEQREREMGGDGWIVQDRNRRLICDKLPWSSVCRDA